MPPNEPQVATVNDVAGAANDLAHKLYRQVECVRDWLEAKDEGACPSASSVPIRPLNQCADCRTTLGDALGVFSQIAVHLGAPVCE